MTNQSNETKQPIHKIPVGNGIFASIWENHTKNGVIHGVEVYRRYKDKDSGEWKTATTYVGVQALLASKAYEMGFEYITCLKASTKA